MINRKHGELVIECDTCGEEDEAEGDDFHEAWDYWKGFGWRAYKSGDEWEHSCPGCVEEWKRSR